jgi:hypothetical protein
MLPIYRFAEAKYNQKPSAADEEPSGRNGKLRPGDAGAPSHQPPKVRFSRAAEKFFDD